MRIWKIFLLWIVFSLNCPVKSQSLTATPNPFNKRTLATYNLVNSDSVSLDVINVSGQIVTTIFSNSLMLPGNYQDSVRLDNYPSGIYFLFLKLKQGGTKTVKVIKTDAVGIESITVGNGIKIYPNPFKSKLCVEFETIGPEELKLSILNTLGETICTLNAFISKQEIDVSHLPAGIYFVKVENKTGQKTFKFLKE